MELSNEDKLKLTSKVLASLPELLGVFIVMDVRQKNLTGKHIGASSIETPVLDNDGNVKACTLSTTELLEQHRAYMMLNQGKPYMDYLTWLRVNHPECEK